MSGFWQTAADAATRLEHVDPRLVIAALGVDGLISQAFGELSAALAEPARMAGRAA